MPNLCHSILASFLKLLNFLQTFVGISIILYSAWILNHSTIHSNHQFHFNFDLDNLPAPWFVCGLMGAGVLMCLVALTGHVAAECISGCCLCFHAVLTTMLILLEAALVGDIVFNKHWEEDLPYDSTGQLKRLRAFIEDNIDVVKWMAASVIIIQVLSLFLSLVLRATVPSRRVDYDSDEDFVVIRRPLLNPQAAPILTAAPIDSKGYHSDTWSSRMRQKYGLNQN